MAWWQTHRGRHIMMGSEVVVYHTVVEVVVETWWYVPYVDVIAVVNYTGMISKNKK